MASPRQIADLHTHQDGSSPKNRNEQVNQDLERVGLVHTLWFEWMPAMQETLVQFLGLEVPLEKG